MKKTLLVLIVVLSLNNAFAQNDNKKESFRLALESSTNTSRADLLIKSDSKIKIKTLDGRIIKSSDYFLIKDSVGQDPLNSINSNFIVMNTQDSDTVALANIVWIKGRVAKAIGRKVLGGIVTAVSIALIFLPVVGATVGAVGFTVLSSIGILGVMTGGISLMGSHKYHTKSEWKIKVVSVYSD